MISPVKVVIFRYLASQLALYEDRNAAASYRRNVRVIADRFRSPTPAYVTQNTGLANGHLSCAAGRGLFVIKRAITLPRRVYPAPVGK
jgi:hypothetical protein